jgi:hypothetical protein
LDEPIFRASTRTRPADPATPGRSGRRARTGLGRARLPQHLGWTSVLVAPLLGVAFLRAPIVNALPNNDTWFYSGYGWALAHHVDVFGWFYYADRFTVVLPIAWSTALLGPVGGYVALRYLLMAGTGAVLYACSRRFASPLVAACGVLLLALDPFYVRLMLWDYTTFVALPCTIAGAAFWWLGKNPGRALMARGVSGALLATAIYANPLSFLVLPALYGVEAVAAVRSGKRAVAEFATGLLASLAAAIGVFIAGYLAYRAYLGSFPIKDMYESTLEFIRSNNRLSAPFQRPASVWLKTEPRIWGPVLVCVALVVVLGPALLRNTLRSRVAHFALAYTAVFWIYRFAFTSSDIETWWAYSMTAVTAAFAMPAMLDEVARRAVSRTRLLVAATLVVTAAADLLIRSARGTALSMYDYLRFHPFPLLVVLGACCLAAVGITLLRRPGLRFAALAAFFAITAVITLTPADYLGTRQTGEFSPYGGTEVKAYRAAYDLTRLIASRDRPQSRVLLWDDLYGLSAISWTNLPHQGGGIENVEAPVPLTQLTPSEVALLVYPTTTHVLVLSQSESELASTLFELRKLGLRPTVERSGAWVDGALHYSLIYVHQRA